MISDEQYAWYNTTPPESTYELQMLGTEETAEAIELTREEYIYLKRCIAEQRGIEHGLAGGE